MTSVKFAKQLRYLCMDAFKEGEMDASQIIGNLEIAKLNMDRIFVGMAQAQSSSGIVPASSMPNLTVLPPNGEGRG